MAGDMMDVMITCDDMPSLEPMIANLREQNVRYEIAECESLSHLVVSYTELSTPNMYGHHEISFETYGGIVTVLNRLVNWVKHTERVFGPDWRDVRDYFRHCTVMINGQDKTEWFRDAYVSKLSKDMYFA